MCMWFMRGGCIWEVPTRGFWLGKIWCFRSVITYGRWSLARGGHAWIKLDYITGKNNGAPLLDIWDKSQPGNSQLSSQSQTCLTLPNLGFLWVFFKYPKISKNENPLVFPVTKWNLDLTKSQGTGKICLL